MTRIATHLWHVLRANLAATLDQAGGFSQIFERLHQLLLRHHTKPEGSLYFVSSLKSSS